MAIGISSDRPVQAADPSQRDQPLAPNLQDSLACRDGQLYTHSRGQAAATAAAQAEQNSTPCQQFHSISMQPHIANQR